MLCSWRWSATKVPRPGTRSSRPSVTSASSAWRTVIRATPKYCTSSRSEGAGVPGIGSLHQGADVLADLHVLVNR